MTTIEDVRDKLIESIVFCRGMLHSDLPELDREYISGMRSAFDKVLRFIVEDQ